MTLKGMVILTLRHSKYWMRDNGNEHQSTSIEYRKGWRRPVSLFLLFIVLLQYHTVTSAGTYDEQKEMKGNYAELITKGNEAYNAHRFSDAITAYESALVKSETADSRIKLGTAYLANRDYRNALQAFQKISRPPELDSDLFISIGVCLENLGNSEGALCAYRNAVTLSPLSKKANLKLASTLRNYGKLEDALAVYGYILQVWPDVTETLIDIGNLYLDKGEYNNAIDTFESAQRMGVGSAELKRSIADLYLNNNMHREAALFYQSFITSSQDVLAEDLYRLGNAYYMGGENLSAQETLQKAIDKKPDYDKAHLLLGSIYVEELKPNEARREYEKAIEIDPKQASAHIALANLYIETGEKEKAANEYRIAINLGQKDASIFYNLIVMLLEVGRREESAQIIKEALRIHPQNTSLKNLLERVVETSKSNPETYPE